MSNKKYTTIYIYTYYILKNICVYVYIYIYQGYPQLLQVAFIVVFKLLWLRK